MSKAEDLTKLGMPENLDPASRIAYMSYVETCRAFGVEPRRWAEVNTTMLDALARAKEKVISEFGVDYGRG